MNITLVPTECNKAETIMCPLSSEEFIMLQKEGLIARKSRTYHMTLQHKDIQVECPVLLNDKRSVGVILPAFKLPYRSYPCYVYLFAILLHLMGDSMRRAAVKVQKRFGLSRFSHSTISRSFALLALKADLLAEVSLSNGEDTPTPRSFPGRSALMVRSSWSQEIHRAAARIFPILFPLLDRPELGVWLFYRYFMRYCCLLL